MSQQQHVGIVEAPPLPSITPPHSLSLSPFHSSASPSLSFSCTRRYAPLHVSLRHENEHHREPPVSLYLHPLSTETHFDHLLSQPQTQHQALLLVWMANWCRKCIYLKPKLEKLAADYYPRLQFYSVDVNTVSHKLVARAGVTKMPTIQLWKDSNKQAEVIGGHKAYLVINEVQEMIENECPESFSAAD